MYSNSTQNHHRKGADGTTVYVCDVCIRVEVTDYDAWLFHLGTREHQVNLYKSSATRRWRNSYSIRPKTVEAVGIYGLKAKEMLEYFRTWGEIQDFDYAFRNKGEDGITNNCLCVFKERDSVDAVLRSDMGHEITGKRFQVTRY